MDKRLYFYLMMLLGYSCSSPVGYIPTDQVVTPPRFNLASGLYTSEQTLQITTPSSGAQIRYTTDGTEPSLFSILYTGPIVLTDRGFPYNFRAAAFRSDLRPSSSVEASFEVVFPNLGPLTLAPSPGSFSSDITLTASCSTPGTFFYYTIDGTTPTPQSPSLPGLDIQGHLTAKNIKVLAFKPGFRPSYAAGLYQINYNQVSTPQFSQTPGIKSSDILGLTLSCITPGSDIYYSVDGSDPLISGYPYLGPFNFTGHGTTKNIKIAAVKSGMNPSSVNQGVFTVNYLPLPAPSMNPTGGSFNLSQVVDLSCSEPGVAIYYTDNGLDPSPSSTLYTGSINITGDGTTKTIKALATKPGFLNSPLSSNTYEITYAKVSTPVPNVLPGTKNSDFSLTFSCDHPLATILWSMDDLTTPYLDESEFWYTYTRSPQQTIPINTEGAHFRLKARALYAGLGDSVNFDGEYYLDYPNLQPLSFDQAPGSYPNQVSVGISSLDSGVSILYTIDGSDPKTFGIPYLGPILVAAVGKTKTIRAYSTKSGYTDSPVVSADYSIPRPITTLGTLAGSGLLGQGDGLDKSQLQLYAPEGATVDSTGVVYVSDTQNNRVRKIAVNGMVSTILGKDYPGAAVPGSKGVDSTIDSPSAIAVDPSGNLYIAEKGQNRILKLGIDGYVYVVMGTAGQPGIPQNNTLAAGCMVTTPAGFHFANNRLYVADSGAHMVYYIDFTDNKCYVVAGTGVAGNPVNGPAVSAKLTNPEGVFAYSDGSVYIASTGNHAIVKVITNALTRVVGDGGNATSLPADGVGINFRNISTPVGIFFNGTDLYFTTKELHAVQRLTASKLYTVTGNGSPSFAGDGGPFSGGRFNSPLGMTFFNNVLYLVDQLNYRIRKLNFDTGLIYTDCGTGEVSFSGDGALATAAQLYQPTFLTRDSLGNTYVSDTGNHRIRKVDFNGNISTLVGTGSAASGPDGSLGTAVAVNTPMGLIIDPDGNLVFADGASNRIRKINLGTNIVTTLVHPGTTGAGDINKPCALAYYAGELYFTLEGNHQVRKLNSGGTVVLVAGNGAQGFSGDGAAPNLAQLNSPKGLVFDSGGILFVADYGNNRVRKISAGQITTVAGDGASNFVTDILAVNTSLKGPYGLTMDSVNRLLISEETGYRIRILDLEGYLTDYAGDGLGGISIDGQSNITAFHKDLRGVIFDNGRLFFIENTLNKARYYY